MQEGISYGCQDIANEIGLKAPRTRQLLQLLSDEDKIIFPARIKTADIQ